MREYGGNFVGGDGPSPSSVPHQKGPCALSMFLLCPSSALSNRQSPRLPRIAAGRPGGAPRSAFCRRRPAAIPCDSCASRAGRAVRAAPASSRLRVKAACPADRNFLAGDMGEDRKVTRPPLWPADIPFSCPLCPLCPLCPPCPRFYPFRRPLCPLCRGGDRSGRQPSGNSRCSGSKWCQPAGPSFSSGRKRDL
jgi:hypothetical protein